MSDETATLPEWAKQLQEALIQSNEVLRKDLVLSQETLRKDLLHKIECLLIDVSQVTQHERRQARVGPYSEPIRPEVEPSNNSHGAFIWETRPASPRFG
jgi:hypothetical protein